MKLRQASETVKESGWTSAISEDNTLLIPEELLEELGWKTYTHVSYSIKNGSLIIREGTAF
tara:strand:- start:311 stop:493 length:183 start_codon:yes stop_codon:yes gene_type:complete